MGLDAVGDKAFAYRVQLCLVQAVEGGGDFSATACAHKHFKPKHLVHHPVWFASSVWGAFLLGARISEGGSFESAVVYFLSVPANQQP